MAIGMSVPIAVVPQAEFTARKTPFNVTGMQCIVNVVGKLKLLGQEASMAIFESYPSKHETRRQVSTWNYEVVYANGTIRVHDDERFVRRRGSMAQTMRKAG